ncbi:hypothetical protein BSKO_06831 [Bryopsis sp. KO-2023]|nr:hypothetical protein BSKO_06831 [Bryopsis sp. KO-2023]
MTDFAVKQGSPWPANVRTRGFSSPMWRGVLLAVVLAAALSPGTTAQEETGCKDVRKLSSSTGFILLDVDTLAGVEGGIQQVFNCLPEKAEVKFDLTEMKLDDTLKIKSAVSIKGSRTTIPCLDDKTQPAVDIRANDVLLAGFSFVGCNINSTSGLLHVKKSENVILKDIVFENNANTKGPACVSAIGSTIQMENITTKDNEGVYGGAISVAKGGSTVVMDSLFESNHATEQGGAIYVQNSDLNLSDSRFIENLAFDEGGAIFVKGEKGSEVNIRDVEFVGNRVYGEYKNDSNWRPGGGIAFLGPKLNAQIFGATFVNNSAVSVGGAISAFNGTMISVQESTFIENHSFQGGALHVQSSLPNVTSLELERCVLRKNHARFGYEGFHAVGGAIAMFNNGTEATLKDCTFVKNKAGVAGGALNVARSKKIKISRSEFVRNQVGNFDPHTANEGVAVENENKSVLIRGGAVNFVGIAEISILESNFAKNQANIGGALYVEALESGPTNLEVRGTTFEKNSAEGNSFSDSYFGGAMALLGNGTSITLDNVTFSNNVAGSGGEAAGGGGAIFGSFLRSVKISGSKFNRNKAMGQKAEEGVFLGGALFISELPQILIKKSTFTDNQAQFSGGALAIHAQEINGSDVKITGCTFDGNSAVGDPRGTFGGAFYLVGAVLRASIKGSNFTKNNAFGFSSGGAAYGLRISGLEISHCSFSENKVVKSEDNNSFEDAEKSTTFGGAIRLVEIPETAIVDSSFVHNEANSGGGIDASGGILLLEGSSFQDNVVTSQGGAIRLSSTNATIIKSNFTRNTGLLGGAIDASVAVSGEGKAHLEAKEVQFKHNSASLGGLRLLGVDLEMEDSLFQNNSAEIGGAIHLIEFQASSPNASIKATSFLGNRANDVGGGIYVQQVDLSLSRCAFEANVARFQGGAMFCEDESFNLIKGNKNSIVTMHSSNFTGNRAGENLSSGGVESITSKGGAVVMSGLGLVSEFKDCHFSKNVASRGGAMYVFHAKILTLEDSTFRMGAALTGGALSVISGEVMVNNVSFFGNAAKFGGAVSFGQSDTATFETNLDLVLLKHVQFVENVALEGGGAVDLKERSFGCESCIFDSNAAGFGGKGIASGGAIRALPATNLTLVNSSIINCTAAQSGGGVYLEDAIFRGENIIIRNNAAIEKGGGFAMHFASFASSRSVPWGCSSCDIRGNQAKNGGGLHVSAEETTQPNCLALGYDLFVEDRLADCEPSLEKSEVPEPQVQLNSTKFGGNQAEDSGSDIFLSSFKNNICCDDKCWSAADAMEEGVQKCGLGGISQRDRQKPAPLGTIFESVSISPSEIADHASGEELPGIKVTPLDAFGQISLDNVTLRVGVTTPGGELFGSPVTSEGVLMSGALTVPGMFLRALPDNYNLSFKLTSKDGKRIVTEFITVAVRECVIGEVSREDGLRCDRCADDFFSFDVTDENCTPCPVEKAKCSGGRLAPLDGFWHSGPRSSQLHACLTEEACTYPNRTNFLFASNFNSTRDYPQCAQGYSDVLCGSCDTSHGRSRFKCTECQGGVPAGLGIGVVMLALALLSLIFVKSAARYSQGVLAEQSSAASASGALASGSHGGLDLTAYISGTIPDEDVEHQNTRQNAKQRKLRSSDVFKILVNFFQVTGSAAVINVSWTRSMQMVLSSWDVISGVADSSNFFSLECAFSLRENHLPRSIQTSIFLAVVPFMVWAALVVVYYAYALRSKKSFQDIMLWSGVALSAVQQASYISMTRTLVRIFYCVSASPVGGLLWVQDTGVVCYRGSHAFLVGFVGVPGLLLISLGFPGWLLYKLTRSTDVLEQEEVIRRYGFLYQAYKKNTAAWEVVILLRKALLAAVVVFGRTLGTGIQGNLAIFTMMGSIILQMYFQPFMQPKLNILELGSLAISTLAFIIGNLVDQPEMTHGGRVVVSIIFIMTAVIYIAYMLKEIVDVFFVELREWMENANLGCPLPTGNIGLLKIAIKTQRKKTNTALNIKKDAVAKSFSSCWS